MADNKILFDWTLSNAARDTDKSGRLSPVCCVSLILLSSSSFVRSLVEPRSMFRTVYSKTQLENDPLL